MIDRVCALLLGILLLLAVPAAAQETFTVWHYETSALAASWSRALELFHASHPNVRIVVTVKTFDEIIATADRILRAEEVPDVMEFNKGNSNTGFYSARGDFRNLTIEAQRRGWDKLFPARLQTTARYDGRGFMGAGSWYGVSSYGEFVVVYYNKALFRKAGLKVPATLNEFEASLAALKKAGPVPLALGAVNYPAQHLLYELYLARATRTEVDDYQSYRAPVDFGRTWKAAADTMANWASAGYFSPDALTLDDEGMFDQFRSGRAAMMVGGSWFFPRLLEGEPDLDWGTFLFPGNKLHPGSGGNLWVVPSRSRHPEWAAEFIDLTLRRDVQTSLANGGGIAVNADWSQVTNPRAAELIRSFDQVMRQDGLAYYADWPALGYYETLISASRDLIRGVPVPKVLDGLDLAYKTKKGRL